jgi:hypothetical protein
MMPKKTVITIAVETMLSWKIFNQPGSLRFSPHVRVVVASN